MISAAVGAGCLLVVVVLNLTRHGAPRTTRPNRNTVVSVVSVVAFLKLAGVVLAFLLIGVFTDLGALEMGIIGVVESLAVIWLLVGTTPPRDAHDLRACDSPPCDFPSRLPRGPPLRGRRQRSSGQRVSA